MQPHQQRVVDELSELSKKLVALVSFISRGEIFATLAADEQSRLRRQRDAMQEYADILEERIAAFA
jgi:hypothetical protein